MVDTQVLVYGVAGPTGLPSTATDEHRRWAADCRALLMQLEPIYVSTITATEFLPYLPPERAASAKSIIDRFHRVAFDAAAEELASKLIPVIRSDPARCRICWGVKESSACKGCGNAKSHAQRLNDVYIAASAATADEVRVLYTYDGGIHAIASKLPGVELRRPPHAGGEIFEHAAKEPTEAERDASEPGKGVVSR